MFKCSKAGNSELETAFRPKFKYKILCHLCLSIKSKLNWQRKPGETIFSANINVRGGVRSKFKQVAQWATIAHLGASIILGGTLIYDAQRQVTLNLNCEQELIQ